MRSEIFKIKAMTERVVQQDLSERAVYGGSGLWECCMKTIPELYVEEMTEMIHFQALPCSHVTGYEVIFYMD